MLIEFRVKNFRSIKDEQALSLAATKDTELSDTNTIETNVKAIPRLVCSAVIYGPNASGKSNLINALGYMRAIVTESIAMRPDQTFDAQNFRLNKATENEPTEFELTFLEEGIRYQYGFTMTQKQIYDEWLLVYKSSKPQQWFSRHLDTETMKYKYEFGSNFIGSRKVWQDATRANALFLSTAINLNNEQLRPIFHWITGKLIILVGEISYDSSTRMLKDDNGKEFIKTLLNSTADISIADISLKDEDNIEFSTPEFHHKTEQGSAIFDFDNESMGTQRLFALAAPINDVLNRGAVLVVDELNSSFHPLLAKHLVALFQDPEINTKGAQLIFTTHDTTLLSSNLFRRDQIWWIDKNREQATVLYPLTDFSN